MAAIMGTSQCAAIELFKKTEEEYTKFRYEHNKLFTSDPFPVQPGRVQLSPMYLFLGATDEWGDNWDLNPRGTTIEHTGLLIASTGVVRDVDISASIGFSDILDEENPARTGGGFTDFGIGSTIMFYHTRRLEFAISYIPTFLFPSGTRSTISTIGPSQEAYIFDHRLAANADWKPKLITCADIGYSFFINAGNATIKGIASTSWAVGYQVLDWLQPEVEFGYFYAIGRNAPNRQGFTVAGGLIMPVSRSVRVDFGAQYIVVGKNNPNTTLALLDVAITF